MRLIFFVSLQTPLLGFLCFPSLSLFAFPPMDAGNTARQILSLLEGSPTEEKKELLKNVMELHHSERKGASTPSLSVEGDYLRIRRYFFRSAFFPHCGCPAPPWNGGIRSRVIARGWIYSQIQDQMTLDSWIRRACCLRI